MIYGGEENTVLRDLNDYAAPSQVSNDFVILSRSRADQKEQADEKQKEFRHDLFRTMNWNSCIQYQEISIR